VPTVRGFGLSSAAALLATAATAAGMAGWAVGQWVLHRHLSAEVLVREHLTHVALLVPLLFLALTVGFRRLLGGPLRRLESQLYRIATGNPEPVRLGSRVRELNAIERAANLMVQRMEWDTGSSGLARVDEELEKLHTIADGLEAEWPGQASRLRHIAWRLRYLVDHRPAPHEPDAAR